MDLSTAEGQMHFWRRRAARLRDQCDAIEASFGGCVNERGRKALTIWRKAAADYGLLATKFELKAR